MLPTAPIVTSKGSGTSSMAACTSSIGPNTLPPAVAGSDAIVAAQTALPVKDKPTDEDWARNDRVRVEGTRNLVEAADEGVEWFLAPSVVWVARQPDGSSFDERADRYPDRATRSVADLEDLLLEAAARASAGGRDTGSLTTANVHV